MRQEEMNSLGNRMKYIVRDICEEFDRNEAQWYDQPYRDMAKRKYVKWRLGHYYGTSADI